MQDFGTTALHYPAGEIMVMLCLQSRAYYLLLSHMNTALASVYMPV